MQNWKFISFYNLPYAVGKVVGNKKMYRWVQNVSAGVGWGKSYWEAQTSVSTLFSIACTLYWDSFEHLHPGISEAERKTFNSCQAHLNFQQGGKNIAFNCPTNQLPTYWEWGVGSNQNVFQHNW